MRETDSVDTEAAWHAAEQLALRLGAEPFPVPESKHVEITCVHDARKQSDAIVIGRATVDLDVMLEELDGCRGNLSGIVVRIRADT